jgi:hypothetical protein
MYRSKIRLPGMTGNMDVHSNVYEHHRVGLKVTAGDRCDLYVLIDANRQVVWNVMNLQLLYNQ